MRWKKQRIADLELEADGLNRQIQELRERVGRLEAGKLELKPSRKPMKRTAPRCAHYAHRQVGRFSEDVQCSYYTRDPSGYCHRHRDGVVKANGLVQSTQDGGE